MSKKEKLLQRLKLNPKDFTYYELKILLNYLGFKEYNKGKTLGSAVKFIDNYNRIVELHKPHPRNIIKSYKIKEIIKQLYEWEMI